MPKVVIPRNPTRSDAARAFQCSTKTIERAEERFGIRKARVGRTYVLDTDDLIRWGAASGFSVTVAPDPDERVTRIAQVLGIAQ